MSFDLFTIFSLPWPCRLERSNFQAKISGLRSFSSCANWISRVLLHCLHNLYTCSKCNLKVYKKKVLDPVIQFSSWMCKQFFFKHNFFADHSWHLIPDHLNIFNLTITKIIFILLLSMIPYQIKEFRSYYNL